MSHTGKIRRFFGEGDFDFALTIGAAEDLEQLRADEMRKAGHGPGAGSIMAVQARLATGQFLLNDIRQTLRLALVGAGMETEEAYRLVTRNLKPGAILKAAGVAGDIIDAFLIGDADDQPKGDASGETDGPPDPTQPGSLTGASDGPGSTDRALQSA